MGNIVLADEINRTSPKTQSSLLEAMEEGNVTIDGKTMRLAEPFFVMATQNPVEYEGTYPLPEAQLDRFLFKLRMGYPTAEEELRVLSLQEGRNPLETIEPVISKEQFISLQQKLEQVRVDDGIKAYIVGIIQHTRRHPSVHLGVSPRGSISLMKAAQAYALLHDRDYVIPDDVQYLAPYTLPHRMILTAEAKFNDVTAEAVIEDIMQTEKFPFKGCRSANEKEDALASIWLEAAYVSRTDGGCLFLCHVSGRICELVLFYAFCRLPFTPGWSLCTRCGRFR